MTNFKTRAFRFRRNDMIYPGLADIQIEMEHITLKFDFFGNIFVLMDDYEPM